MFAIGMNYRAHAAEAGLGTPSGIGWARDPKVVLRPGDRLVTPEVIGEMTITFTAA